MQHIILSLLLIINLSISLFASNATTEEHLLSLSPTENAEAVKPKSKVEVTFNREIVESSLVDDTIALTPINPQNEKVNATLTIKDNSTLLLTPNELLLEGEYRVRVNPVVLKANQDDYELSSWLEKLIYWLCSFFYDDISECPLYQQFCTIPSLIKTELIEYNFSVVDKPEILSIKLNKTSLELNEGETTQLNAVATYDDNSTKDITQEAVWSVDNPSVASIDTNATLNATQEGTAQITASLENITSQTLLFSVRKVINGHTLPPAPDPTLNNSTLLGIDSNNNGVRDDVERKIYFRYKRPIEQAFMMQDAKIYPQTLEDPVAAAASKELEKESWDIATCDVYLILQGIKLRSVDFMEESYFNTEERMRAYIKFNEASSGGVYNMPLMRDANKENCDFNITKLLEIEK